jgi:hypothetical protein
MATAAINNISFLIMQQNLPKDLKSDINYGEKQVWFPFAFSP